MYMTEALSLCPLSIYRDENRVHDRKYRQHFYLIFIILKMVAGGEENNFRIAHTKVDGTGNWQNKHKK